MIILILIIGFILRLLGLNQSLWLDEAITAQAVTNNSFIELITRYAPGDFHPPLYYLVLKAWAFIFGTSEIALRLPSVIFSVVTIYFVYLIGKNLWNKRAGLVASVFFAVNPLAIYYAQETRMYSLAALLIAVSSYAVIKKNWLLFLLSFVLCLYTDYVPLFMIAVFFFFVPKRFLLGVILFFSPWAAVVVNQLQIATEALGQTPAWAKVLGAFDSKAIPLTFVKFTIGRITISNKILYGAASVGIAGLYGFILLRARSKIIWQWLIAPLLIGLIISVKIPLYSYFRFLFVLPAFCLLLSRGVRESKILTGAVIVISILSLSVFLLSPDFQREDWRSAVNTINQKKGIILMPSVAQSAPLEYYGAKWNVSDNKSVIDSHERVYLFRYVQELFDPQDLLRQELENKGFVKVSEQNFNSLVLWTYENKTIAAKQ